MTRLRPTTGSSPRGWRWPTTDHRPPLTEAARILDEVELATLAPLGRASGARLPALLDRQGQAGTGAVVAAALAGTFRPCRVADDPGLLVVDDLAGCACGVDRHLDLSQPAAAVPTAADRPVR